MVVILGGEVRYFSPAIPFFSTGLFSQGKNFTGVGEADPAGRRIGRFLVQRCRHIPLNFGIFAEGMFFTGNGKKKGGADKNDAGASSEAHEWEEH